MATFELTGAQARDLSALAQTIADLQEVVERAEKAGLDMREQREALAQLERKRAGLLAQFPPGTAPRRNGR